MRGILSHSSRLLRINGITPAHAGNTICEAEITLVVRDHPRTRGEYLLWHYYLRPSQGSPPHTRGIPQPVPQPQPQPGITPAHAGNTEGFPKIIHANGDHPRTRGEYRLALTLLAIIWGSPPHTRGILACRYIDLRYGGITPAHAGNTIPSLFPSSSWRDHPRTRGEYSIEYDENLMKEGSPPHTRGILPDCLDAIKQAGITPAHAGNTDSNNPEAGTQGDHPRTRGEYVQGFGEIFGGVGSPPHTRGIPMTLLFTKFFNGITPAHAGNTTFGT